MNKNSEKNLPFPVIRKRDGRLCRFDLDKITEAIYKSLYATGMDSRSKAEYIASLVVSELTKTMEGTLPQVEEIQDAVENTLISQGLLPTAKAYILYRAKRTSIRDGKSELMDIVEDILENENASTTPAFFSPHARMMEIARSASSAFYLSRIIPSLYSDAHRKGEIYIHSIEYFDKTVDSIFLKLKPLIEKGFCGGYAFLKPPKRVATIAAQAAIILQSCQNELFGEVAFDGFDKDLGAFIRENLAGTEEKEIYQAMEGFVYNLNTLYSKTSFQLPLSSISIGLDTSPEGRAVAFNFLKAVEAGLGNGETPLYPEVVFYVKNGVNFNEGDPNYDLFDFAVRVSCKRMNPSFVFSDAPCNTGKKVIYWGGGARREFSEESGIESCGNIASVTINLTRAAFFATLRRENFLMSSFYSELRRITELACELSILRLEETGKLKAENLPFIIGEKIYAGSESLYKSDPIFSALKNGCFSLGISGLAECLRLLTGKEYGKDDEAGNLALEIVKYIKKIIDSFSEKTGFTFFLASICDKTAGDYFYKLDNAEFPDLPAVAPEGRYSQGFSLPDHFDFEEKIRKEAPFFEYFNGAHYCFIKTQKPPEPEEAMRILKTMKESGVGFGGFSFELIENGACNEDLYSSSELPCTKIRRNPVRLSVE